MSVVAISPFDDKTSKVRIEFRDRECNSDYGYCYTFPISVELEKNGERSCLRLIEPGMAALLTEYLLQRKLFKTRKQIIMHFAQTTI